MNKTSQYSFTDSFSLLKKGIWTYFILLIFEGALRKWVLPGLATPLLIIRDPVAICLLIMAWRKGIFIFNTYVIAIFIIALLSIFIAVIFGHGSLLVALYGARIYLVHFPIIFVIGSVFNRKDVLTLGKVIIWLSIPMIILLVYQFYSPQSAWVNRGIGGDLAGGGFSGALGFSRGPTTFSFTNGTALFFSFVACFVFYFWMEPKKFINKSLLILSTIALIMSIPFSISRTLFFSVLLIAVFVLFVISKKSGSLGRIIVIFIVVVVLVTIISQLSFFQTATEAFVSRFNSASESEGGVEGTLGNRYLGGFLIAFESSSKLPFFGYGIGMGTNAGGFLLTGATGFLVSEEEWGRLIGELGLLMGTIVIIIRLGVSYKIAIASLKALSAGDFLPWILLSFCLLTLPQAQWAQPTALGFSVFVAGITIAALKKQDTSILYSL